MSETVLMTASLPLLALIYLLSLVYLCWLLARIARAAARLPTKNGRRGQGSASVLAGEEIFQVVAAAHALPIDEDLWCRGDALLCFESIDLDSRAEDMILDGIAIVFEHLLGTNAKRTGVIGQDHSVNRCRPCIGHEGLRGASFAAIQRYTDAVVPVSRRHDG